MAKTSTQEMHDAAYSCNTPMHKAMHAAASKPVSTTGASTSMGKNSVAQSAAYVQDHDKDGN